MHKQLRSYSAEDLYMIKNKKIRPRHLSQSSFVRLKTTRVTNHSSSQRHSAIYKLSIKPQQSNLYNSKKCFRQRKRPLKKPNQFTPGYRNVCKNSSKKKTLALKKEVEHLAESVSSARTILPRKIFLPELRPENKTNLNIIARQRILKPITWIKLTSATTVRLTFKEANKLSKNSSKPKNRRTIRELFPNTSSIR